MGPTPPNKSVVLNSWKEIAAHLGRGVRTVQRWEHDLGLPVRRPRGTSRSAVVAFAEELDAWLRSAPRSEVGPAAVEQPAALVTTARQSMAHVNELREKCNELRTQHSLAMAALIGNLTKMTKSVEALRQRCAERMEVENAPAQEAQRAHLQRAS
jgi:cell division protein ZapA (FtsZ GTPase activity inhibitor)